VTLGSNKQVKERLSRLCYRMLTSPLPRALTVQCISDGSFHFTLSLRFYRVVHKGIFPCHALRSAAVDCSWLVPVGSHLHQYYFRTSRNCGGTL